MSHVLLNTLRQGTTPSRTGHSLDHGSPLWPPWPGKTVKLFLSTSPKTLVSANFCSAPVNRGWVSAIHCLSRNILFYKGNAFFILIKQLSSCITSSLRRDSKASTNLLFFLCNFKNKTFVLTLGLSNLLVGLLSFLSNLSLRGSTSWFLSGIPKNSRLLAPLLSK